MTSSPLVSVIIIFLNAERFIEEAIASVLAQSYTHLELLLVDDGSTDRSTRIAQGYADQYPDRVRYLTHPDHANRGMSAARNLGAHNARGEFIAFLDADDIWLPHKLEVQVGLMEAAPDAGMLYGNTKYWSSWDHEAQHSVPDFVPELGVPVNKRLSPPALIPLYLKGGVAVPCTCSIMVRSDAFHRVGGFEESFRGLYEDQAFYIKICLQENVYAARECLDWYRQHPNASVSVASRLGHETLARRNFLNWVSDYLLEQQVTDPDIWGALNKEEWLLRHISWSSSRTRVYKTIRWFKKWVLRVEERVLPGAVDDWLWSR